MSTTLRVAMAARAFYPWHGFGGIERHVGHLSRHLSDLGVAVTLFVQPATDRAAAAQPLPFAVETLRYDRTSPLLPPNGVIGRQINFPLYSLQLGAQLAAAVRAGRFDVVHTQGLSSFGYALQRRLGRVPATVPFIANPHGMEEFRTPDRLKYAAYAPFRAWYRFGHQAADRVIATDACTRDDVPHYLHVDPARVVVLPSAIDVRESLAPLSAQRQAALIERFRLHGSLRLLSVGRLEPNKGFDLLCEALAALRGELPPDWQWLLVGSGSFDAELRRRLQELGLAAHVQMISGLSDDDLHNLYELVDLFVHPTRYEGSSLVTLEAMIHRRPVIASAAGGIPDKVFPGRNGLLVPPGDGPALQRALRDALAQRAAWPAWGEAGAAIVRSTFDWPVVARATRDLYRELLAQREHDHA
jgi:glycogen(starch) synthase